MSNNRILFSGGKIVDGSKKPPYRGNLLIEGDKIIDIGPHLPDQMSGVGTIPLDNLLLVPGFIDTHSHSDIRIFDRDKPLAKIKQGVCTEILGQDGLGAAPIAPGFKEKMKDLVSGLAGEKEEWDWSGIGEYMDKLIASGSPVNIASLVPHGNIRASVMDFDDRRASFQEIEKMKKNLEKELEEGALGLSTGLVYPPCVFADQNELFELNSVVAKHDKVFVVHPRCEGRNVVKAIEEIIQVARMTGVKIHFSHLLVSCRENWKQLDRVFKLIEEGLAEGLTITCDRYPYIAGSSVLTVLFPPWSLEGGKKKLLERLGDEKHREKIKHDILNGLPEWENRAPRMGWENIVISRVFSRENKDIEGKNLEEISKQKMKKPVDVMLDITLQENAEVVITMFFTPEEQYLEVLSKPYAMVCTDGIYGGKPHPRLFGSFPRAIEKLTGAKNFLSLQETIRKMTGYPAEVFGLSRRGMLKKDYFADLVVLDLGEISSPASYEHPQQYPGGIKHVYVNGRAVIKNGEFTGQLPGQKILVK